MSLAIKTDPSPIGHSTDGHIASISDRIVRGQHIRTVRVFDEAGALQTEDITVETTRRRDTPRRTSVRLVNTNPKDGSAS